jgi:polyisoprenyl-teichoic acid--peptidoglycan teichoic acid transferase
MRYDDPQGDYGRQMRQQQILTAVIGKLKSNPTTVLSQKF